METLTVQTAPWRRIRDGLFQTRDGRWRALWDDGDWWIIRRSPEGDQWIDTRPLLRDVKRYVAEQYQLQDVTDNAYHLEHDETERDHRVYVRDSESRTFATVHVNKPVNGMAAMVHQSGVSHRMTPELAEAIAMALQEAAMLARQLDHEHERRGA